MNITRVSDITWKEAFFLFLIQSWNGYRKQDFRKILLLISYLSCINKTGCFYDNLGTIKIVPWYLLICWFRNLLLAYSTNSFAYIAVLEITDSLVEVWGLSKSSQDILVSVSLPVPVTNIRCVYRPCPHHATDRGFFASVHREGDYWSPQNQTIQWYERCRLNPVGSEKGRVSSEDVEKKLLHESGTRIYLNWYHDSANKISFNWCHENANNFFKWCHENALIFLKMILLEC